MRALPLLVALLFFLSTLSGGTSAAAPSGTVPPDGPTPQPARSLEDQQAPPDPAGDPIGWEAGYWHNESIDVDQSDGLSDAELEAYVGRAMARVEFIRDREFREPVDVDVELRSEYRNRTQSGESNASFAAWNNQVWEALLIDGEDSNVQDELRASSAESVVGFYSVTENEIKVITETPERPVISNTTLIHELVHALQDQYYDLESDKYRGGTQDRDLAVQGAIEGEANYIEAIYTSRCGGAWDCVATPSQPRSGGGTPNFGILLTIIQPYSDGPVLVSDRREQGGWAAVDALLEDPPASTEQVIHLTEEPPGTIPFEDRARNGWEPFPDQGENGSDTVGEASIYMMFWVQSRELNIDVIDWRALLQTDSQYDLYNYQSTPSDGWDEDRVFPYRKQTNSETEYGYVWLTEWDTEQDARQFHDAYLTALEARGATHVRGNLYEIPDGPFADAFRIVRVGTSVRIVNAPTVADVDDIRPGRDQVGSPDGTVTGTPTVEDDANPRGPFPSQPGFGPILAVIALTLVVGIGRYLSRQR